MFKDIHSRPLRDDRLLITATLEEDGRQVQAFGWQSALTNHFDEASLNPDTGQRQDTAKPRHMTPSEEDAYYTRLLSESIPQEVEE